VSGASDEDHSEPRPVERVGGFQNGLSGSFPESY
jgi:hypothetical protein